MKILLISNFFFPNNHVGAVRPTRLYEYLKRNGHDVTVITTSIADSPIGNSRYDYQYQKKDILRIPDILSSSKKQNDKTSGTIFNPMDILKKINIAQIDIHLIWISKVVLKIVKEKRLKKYDWVITTSPEHYNHLLGFILKIIYNIKWITDYRDGWTLNPSFNASNNRLKYYIETFFEQKVLQNCDALTATSPGLLKKLIDIFKPRAQTCINVMNGYDLTTFPPAVKSYKKRETLNIIYAGSIDSNRSPISFFQMLDRFCSEHPEYSTQIEIYLTHYIKGTSTFKNNVKAASKNKRYKVKWLPFMPLRKLRHYILENADVMLLCLGDPEKDESEYNDWVLSKVFDCMGIKKPAFAIVPTRGDTAKIIKETDCGVSIGNSDYKNFKKNILFLINNRTAIQTIFSFNNIERFTRDAQFEKIFKIICS